MTRRNLFPEIHDPNEPSWKLTDHDVQNLTFRVSGLATMDLSWELNAHYAGLAMQSLLMRDGCSRDPKELARVAVEYANALVNELYEDEEGTECDDPDQKSS